MSTMGIYSLFAPTREFFGVRSVAQLNASRSISVRKDADKPLGVFRHLSSTLFTLGAVALNPLISCGAGLLFNGS